jgi:pimeloyl-ACP methyl ester carboxylesterase
MHVTRRLAAVSCLVPLLLCGCDAPSGEDEGPSVPVVSTTSPASTTSATSAVPALVWAPCGEAECATLAVPRDYDDPGAGTFDLGVARRRAENPALRMGVLVFSPGGPGLAGTPGLITGSDRFSVDLRARFDVVSWDPRGVNQEAAVDCVDDPDYFRGLDPTPEAPQEAARLARRARDFIAGCVERSGDLLPYVSTAASARDIDLLRAALGEEQISYLGVSYGAALGAVYATLFPQRVRAMVLDGGYDPSADRDDLTAQGAAARERVLQTILEGCAADRFCYFHNSGDSQAAFERLMALLEATPMPVAPFLPTVDQGEAWRAVLFALPDEGKWTRLTMALHEAQAGVALELLLLSEESVFHGLPDADASVAIGCLDWASREGAGAAGSLGGELADVAARLGTTAAGYLCERWPVPQEVLPPVTGSEAGPILVTAVTGDVVIAFESSRELAGALPAGVLLVVEGYRHGAYQPGSRDRACAVATIDWYLISLTMPADGAVCLPGRPLPQPPG